MGRPLPRRGGGDACRSGLTRARRASRTNFRPSSRRGARARPGVAADVAAIIADVRARGDAALADLTQRFDRVDLAAVGIEIPRATIAAARAEVRRRCARRARPRRRPHPGVFTRRSDRRGSTRPTPTGIRLGYRWSPVDAAGIYVPGGRASYPSSVLMNAIPAKVAGVGRLVMVTPTPDGMVNPLVLVAAELAGVDAVYRVGGAQAIAALAFGTDSIAAVDTVTGPGNAWVAEAKRQVFGRVGIDMVAGPSEVVVVSDDRSDPEWVAADLLAQAEHDAVRAVDPHHRLTHVRRRGRGGGRAAVGHTGGPRRRRARAGPRFGTIVVVPDLAAAVPLIDALAPEHLQLMLDDPAAIFAAVRHAGSIFLGRRTPEAVGDYVAGPNHVLPTGRRARFSSGLGVTDFMKRTTFLDCGPAGLAAIGPAAVALATAEGLPAHADSVARRLGRTWHAGGTDKRFA